MKKILALTFCLALALTQMARAADSDKEKKAKKHAKREAVAAQRATQHSVKRNVQAQRKFTAPRVNQSQSLRRTRSESQLEKRNYRGRSNVARRNDANAQIRARQFQRNQANQAKIRNEQSQRNRVAIERNRNNRNRERGDWNGDRDGNGDRNWNRDRNNWNRNSYAEARRHNWREHHNRDWWRRHHSHTRFVLFGGGYYYWHNNYWYPAYGYDPVYSTYVYDEPIYGYNELPPGQVIANVQAELGRQGYYYGAIDGLIGPMTRSALARYQADHGLYITRAIDEPTLQALGLA